MMTPTHTLTHTDTQRSDKSEAKLHRIKTLEMKLSTVQIKIAETEENKKNYKLNIDHLQVCGVALCSAV
jgi:endo-1,4-beta-mannosidase